MTQYNVMARIKGLKDKAEYVAGPFEKPGQAAAFAREQQAQVPNPQEGDVVFFTQRIEPPAME